MGEIQSELTLWEKKEEEEEAQAQVDIWKYIFGFVEQAVVKCAIELGIAEAIEEHEKPMTLLEISTALGCDPSYLSRIMRFLVHRKIFKAIPITNNDDDDKNPSYVQTPLSRRLMRSGEHSMAAYLLFESSSVMLASWQSLSSRVLVNGNPSFVEAHGEDFWRYAAENPHHSNLFNDAMACDAKVVVRAIVEGCGEVFEGISSLVDVGGGNGTTMDIITKACPWIRGINFDLPHVIDMVPKCDNGVEHVGGDMFTSVPKADAVFLKSVLHDWGDEECIRILKKCREAIRKENGRVIIVESVIEERGNHEDKLKEVGLTLDMVMMSHTNYGKERTLKEWEYVVKMAGFGAYTVKSINAVQSVILVSC
ncbi:hypothetical protein OROMI_003133 [Orobanche minor]